MKFFKSAVVLGLVTGVFAAPVLQDSSSDIATRLTELEDTVYGINNEKRVAGLDFSSNLLQARATITDVKCRDNGITYSKAQITDAVAAENSQENPGKYNNQEGGKKLFNTNVQLYKTSLDRTVRAVFSRKANGQYTYWGLIEHDKGVGNGFHKCP